MFLFDGPPHGRLLVLAHGAGAPMDSPFLAAMAAGLARRGLRVARFEFPYMHARREGGGRRAPDREPELRRAWLQAIEAIQAAEGTDAPGGGALLFSRLLAGLLYETPANQVGTYAGAALLLGGVALLATAFPARRAAAIAPALALRRE